MSAFGKFAVLGFGEVAFGGGLLCWSPVWLPAPFMLLHHPDPLLCLMFVGGCQGGKDALTTTHEH
jgi:hypothetical protein